jgi:hypothetical protein
LVLIKQVSYEYAANEFVYSYPGSRPPAASINTGADTRATATPAGKKGFAGCSF